MKKKKPKTGLISIGSLKLNPEDYEKYKVALEFYGYESTSVYLRQVAIALIKAHERRDSIIQPLGLVTQRIDGSSL